MINLSLNELKLIAQIRNISDYENKSKEDLIKALSEPKPKKPNQTLKPETSKTKPEAKPKITPKQTLKPESKLEVKFNRKTFKKLKKDFDELKHKFLNKDEISEHRKAFYNTKKYKLFESEIEETSKNLNKLKKILKPEPKIEKKVNRKKLEKLREDFDELRHTFPNNDEISEYRKAFYNAKKHKLFESEIDEVRKTLNKLKMSQRY